MKTPTRLYVVIVEDDALRANVLAQQLTQLGHTVCCIVASATDAVDAAWMHRPTVMIMDIRLRESRDGIWAARIVYDMLNIPSVFVTGEQGMFEDARSDLSRTFNYDPVVIQKPVVTVEPIINGINAVLQLSRGGTKRQNLGRTTLFVSYCQRDVALVDAFFAILRTWSRERHVEAFIDRDVVEPGDHHSEVIRAAITRVRVGLLLVSPHYQASKYITNYELPWLHDAEADGARLIPMVISKCDYDSIPIVKDLLAINTRSLPFDEMSTTQRLTRYAQLFEKLDELFKS